MPNHSSPGVSPPRVTRISGISAFFIASLAFLPASVVRSLKMSRNSFVLTMADPPAACWLRPLTSRTDATLRARERGLDEHVDIAIEHPRWVPDLDAGAVVLHHGVRVQHVRADLAPPVRGAHLTALACLLLLLSADPLLEETRLEDAHLGLAILELRSLVLAG